MRLLVVVLLGLLFAAPLSGQYMGVQLGMNRTTFWSPDLPMVDPDAEYHFTGGVLFQVSRLHSGLIYSPRSASISQAIPEGGVAVLGLGIDYLEVPLLVRYGYRRVEWLFGPMLGFKVDCDTEASVSRIGQVSTDCEGPVDPKTFDLGLGMGIGLNFEMGFGVIVTADALFNVGLTSFFEEETVKHRTLAVLTGIALSP